MAFSRDGARDFFRYSPVDNVLFPSRAVARKTNQSSLISSLSRDILSISVNISIGNSMVSSAIWI